MNIYKGKAEVFQKYGDWKKSLLISTQVLEKFEFR